MGNPSRMADALSRTVDRLKDLPALKDYYLAGGTAVALHCGHRVSRDLDFFSLSPTADFELLKQNLVSTFSTFEVTAETDAALHTRCDGVPVDFVRYPYGLLQAPISDSAAVPVASLQDLAAMKLAAIARRGIRRDFWDLYVIVNSGSLSLRECLTAYRSKYGLRASDVYHVLRSLTYYDDAEGDPIFPAGMTPDLWQRICGFFQQVTPPLLKPA